MANFPLGVNHLSIGVTSFAQPRGPADMAAFSHRYCLARWLPCLLCKLGEFGSHVPPLAAYVSIRLLTASVFIASHSITLRNNELVLFVIGRLPPEEAPATMPLGSCNEMLWYPSAASMVAHRALDVDWGLSTFVLRCNLSAKNHFLTMSVLHTPKFFCKSVARPNAAETTPLAPAL